MRISDGSSDVCSSERCYPRNPRFAEDLERARGELPDGDLGFRSMTRDGRRMLVSAISDVEPGASWLYDRGAGSFELLYRTRPEVPSRHMARTIAVRSEEHKSELQSLMRSSYAGFC